ncbi:hypothetical protein DUNSADRAFT_6875 [Dunaliella salina]|uniref:Uncharacterized protein n=1 Tax=Dunaliella salina TaxID=3046 RepID=A0ABQ7GMH8_DUNSA|nr:hypothetical protein DUNSADRAFT_6875 [Dunaliella salina]|eukprot:KAF5835786.1 hypothetical protein DUNSADRAFT_6875 [Dunaliella salina]
MSASSAGPVGEGCEDTSAPGPLCESTEPSIAPSQASTAAPANRPQSTGDSHPSSTCANGSLRASSSYSQLQPLLRSVDSDREAVIFGCEEDTPARQDRVKRLCVRWLDELIIALWHDLQAYIEWKAQDSELLRLTGKSLAELTLELPAELLPSSSVSSRSVADASAGLPSLPPGEWLQRGLLAERLCHDADALLAYRCCIKVGGFNLMALTAIMRLAAHCGEALEVCVCVCRGRR